MQNMIHTKLKKNIERVKLPLIFYTFESFIPVLADLHEPLDIFDYEK